LDVVDSIEQGDEMIEVTIVEEWVALAFEHRYFL
jgi:hypothetical protein